MSSDWYVDETPGHEGVPVRQFFRLLRVDALTVDVVDADGNRRTVNRALWERDMRPAPGPPPTA